MTGATVYAKENYKGTTANTYGFYSFTLEEGSYTIQVSFIGYETYSQTIVLNKNLTIDVELNPISIETQEVVIKGSRGRDNISTTDMGKTEIKIETIKKCRCFSESWTLSKPYNYCPEYKVRAKAVQATM